MSWNYSVQLNDPTNVGGSADGTLVYDLEASSRCLVPLHFGDRNMVVALNIVDTPAGRKVALRPQALLANSHGLNI